MKKLYFFRSSLIIFIATALLSCGKKLDHDTQKVQLKTTKDSINYAYGLLWGNSTREDYFDETNNDEKIKYFATGFNRGYKSGAKNADMYLLGVAIAKDIQEQEKNGILNNAAFVANTDLIIQGIVNAVLNKNQELTQEEAAAFYQKIIEKINASEKDALIK